MAGPSPRVRVLAGPWPSTSRRPRVRIAAGHSRLLPTINLNGASCGQPCRRVANSHLPLPRPPNWRAAAFCFVDDLVLDVRPCTRTTSRVIVSAATGARSGRSDVGEARPGNEAGASPSPMMVCGLMSVHFARRPASRTRSSRTSTPRLWRRRSPRRRTRRTRQVLLNWSDDVPGVKDMSTGHAISA